MLIWGLNVSVVKHALAEVPPMAFNAARFPLAAAAARMVPPDRAGDRARRGEDRQDPLTRGHPEGPGGTPKAAVWTLAG